MGLSLVVGILASLKDNDAEGFAYHAQALQRVNSHLAACGLSQHVEPEACEVWSAEMLSFSGLHDVRRIAAHIDCGRPLPEPNRRDSGADACVGAYYAAADQKRRSMLTRLFASARTFRRGFDHLLLHSDAEGYYLPFDFNEVLFPPADLAIPGGMIGSAPRLLAELEQIAQLLAIPAELSPTSEELWEASVQPRTEGVLWERYGREAFGCVTLREGCRRAIAAGAALAFV